MPIAGDKFYIQGFCLDSTKTSVQFQLSLFENSISVGNKVVINYKAGAKASDFASILPPGITIDDNDRKLSTLRQLLVKPRIITLNEHTVECYDLENRVLNYLVTYDRTSSLIETDHHTAMVILMADVSNETRLRNIIDSSKYFKFLTIPLGTFFSFPLVNTHSSYDEYNSESNVPVYMSKYTQYRLELSKVLLGFYDEVKKKMPEFEVYIGEDALQNSDRIDSNRVSINLDSLANQERRPYMMDRDLIAQIAQLTIQIQTNDHLKHTHIKNGFQNLLILSDLAKFNVKDTKGKDWMSHVEWEPIKDTTQMSNIRDNQGRYAYTLNLNCSIYFYTVKDELYHIIQVIDKSYVNMDNGKGLITTIT